MNEEFVIEVPTKFESNNLNVINHNISSLYNKIVSVLNSDKKKVIFDFTLCDKICPIGIVYISMCSDMLKQRGIKTFYKKPKKSILNIFINEFGLVQMDESGKKIFDQYMVKLSKSSTSKERLLNQKKIIDKIKNGNYVADNETLASIDYILNEIADNAGVHGYKCYDTTNYPLPIYIASFSFPDRIEIAIGDRGQGICNSMKNNINYSRKTNKEILNDILKEGVSGHPKGSPGFGLYFSSESIKLGKKLDNKSYASFNIWSSGYWLKLNPNINITKCNFNKGTLVSFILYKYYLPFDSIIKVNNAETYIEDYIEGVFE